MKSFLTKTAKYHNPKTYTVTILFVSLNVTVHIKTI